MVLAYHSIISAYGFWLPNDPCGSWSDSVHKFELQCFGPATKVQNNDLVVRTPQTRRLREAAKEALDYPPVLFADQQIEVIGRGIKRYVEKSGLTIWALAILDDHLHVVFMRHRYESEKVNNLLKSEATQALIECGVHPFGNEPRKGGQLPPCWGRKWWTVYIDNPAHLETAIRYVEDNPLKDGRERQKWDFVVPYPLTMAEWRGRQKTV
jgi:REP element-mobilizing transposase RayT